jgi:hypothetical protein
MALKRGSVEGVTKNLGRGLCSVLRKTSVNKWRLINGLVFKLRRLIATHWRILIKDKIRAPPENFP